MRASGVKNGAFNIEMVINKEGKLYFLDVGPRNGGYWGQEHLFKQMGAEVRSFINSRDEIGLTFFIFQDIQSRDDVLWDFTREHIKLNIE